MQKELEEGLEVLVQNNVDLIIVEVLIFVLVFVLVLTNNTLSVLPQHP